MKKNFFLVFPLVFTTALAQGQGMPPESGWESDPLDVLESRPSEDYTMPEVPEFQEIPLPGEEFQSLPPKTVDIPDEQSSEMAKSQPSFGEDTGPDHAKEAEFNRIYQTYNQEPTAVEAWDQAVGGRASEVYQVQRGDTLSGISTTLFGDPTFWPKIWSLNNSHILNPHEISPGMAVQFYPGSLSEAPTLGLAPKIGTQLTTTAGEAKVDVSGAPLPAVKKRHLPVLKELPPSLPEHKVLGAERSKDHLDLQLDIRPSRFPAAVEYVAYYITDSKISGVGVITGAEMGMVSAGSYQIVYVKLNGGSSEKNFVVQKNLSEVPDPFKAHRKGQMVEVQGEIEILENVNPQENIYRAIVKKTLQPIEVGSLVTPGRMSVLDPSPGVVETGHKAMIMGGQFDSNRILLGSNSIIFLNAGSEQGFRVGQTLNIFADEARRNKKSGAVINDRIIGAIKIVRVSPGFSTAYVTRAFDDINIGDYVGGQSNLARSGGGSSTSDDFDLDFESNSMDSVVPASGNDDDFDLEL